MRIFGTSGLVDSPSDHLYMRTITLYGCLDRHSGYILSKYVAGDIHLVPVSFSSPRWDNLPSGNQRYPLTGLNLGYMYWGQKHSSE